VRRWFVEYGLTPASEVKLAGAKYAQEMKEHDNPYSGEGSQAV
jgi:hypothetical protein